MHSLLICEEWSGKRDSNPRPLPWQGNALPTELFPHSKFSNTVYEQGVVCQTKVQLLATALSKTKAQLVY